MIVTNQLNTVQLIYNPTFDFIESLFNVAKRKKLDDVYLEKWQKKVESPLLQLIKKEKNSFYFKDASVFSEGLEIFLFSFIFEHTHSSISHFIEQFRRYSEKEFASKIIENMCEIEEMDCDREIFNNTADLARFINTKFEFSKQNKWDTLQFFLNVKKYKEGLLKIFEWHYENNFKEIEKYVNERTKMFVRDFETILRKYENDLVQRFLTGLFPKGSFETLFISVSYFMRKEVISWVERKNNKHWIIAGYDYLNMIEGSLDPQIEALRLLKVLTDESRLKIIKLLSEREYRNPEIAALLGLTKATISHHMNLLCTHNIANMKIDGNKIFYSVDSERLKRHLHGIIDKIL